MTDEKGKFDELVDDKGVKILVDPKALMHVIGTKMDFVDDKLRYKSHFSCHSALLQCSFAGIRVFCSFIFFSVLALHL